MCAVQKYCIKWESGKSLQKLLTDLEIADGCEARNAILTALSEKEQDCMNPVTCKVEPELPSGCWTGLSITATDQRIDVGVPVPVPDIPGDFLDA